MENRTPRFNDTARAQALNDIHPRASLTGIDDRSFNRAGEFRYVILSGRGVNNFSRPVRYSTNMSTANGIRDSKSDNPPVRIGLASPNAAIRALKPAIDGTPARNAIRIPAIAPPAI